MKRLILIFVLLVSIYLIGCDGKPEPIINKGDNQITFQVTEHIWYIKDTGQNFCKRYETFLKKDLPQGFSVVQILGDGNGAYGRDRGYFIMLKEKNKQNLLKEII